MTRRSGPRRSGPLTRASLALASLRSLAVVLLLVLALPAAAHAVGPAATSSNPAPSPAVTPASQSAAAGLGAFTATQAALPPASSFDAYRRRVDQAYALAAKALTSAWRDPGLSQDFAGRLDMLLPGTERVVIDGKTVSTDNSILRTYITRLEDESLGAESRRETLKGVARHLGSLKLAVDEATGPPTPTDPAALKSLLSQADLSSRQSLSQVLGRWIEYVVQRISEWLTHVTSGGGQVTASDIALGVVLVALATLFISLVVFVVRGLSGALARHDEAYVAEMAGPPVVTAAEGLPPDALAWAEHLAAEGRFREATRALFGGAARALVQLGLLRSTRTRTNAELLGDLGPAAPAVVPSLSDLSVRFERAWYGHADPGAEGFAEARSRYADALRTAAEAKRAAEAPATAADPDRSGGGAAS